MKYIFIVNPVSGKWDYTKIIDNIKKTMKGKDYLIKKTKSPNHAMRIAQEYKDNENAIVYSVGGDGTLNEVINGIAKGKCKLGIIPSGTGNDFYKSLSKYNKKESTIDLGLANDSFYFINVASIGFDAQVSAAANKFKEKSKHKKIAYYLGIIKTFINFKYQNYEIKINGKVYNHPYTIVAICNGKYYGGGFQIAPLASFDDDLFDVYLAKKMNRLTLITVFTKLLKGKHEKSKLVKKIKTTEIDIKSNEDIIFNIDGEIIKQKAINIKIVKDAITIYNDQQLVNKILG